MSADNWAVCPRCAARRDEFLLAMDEENERAYGTVLVAEFNAMRKRRDDLAQQPMPETFREDYEIHGVESGGVTVNYAGGCGECGLALSFDSEHPVGVGP